MADEVGLDKVVRRRTRGLVIETGRYGIVVELETENRL